MRDLVVRPADLRAAEDRRATMRPRMDWRTVRFDWNNLRAFLVSAEEGSFTAAARALGSTQPTVGRQVTALEEELGVLLFDRVGARLRLTPAGEALVDHARAMGDAASRVSNVAAGKSVALEGNVSITASELVSAYLLPPIVARLRREHPAIEIEIVASNAVRDLRRREADVAIRNVRPDAPDLVARKLGDRAAYPYATPAYLERFGPPTKASELGGLELFAFDRSDRMIEYLGRLGVPVTAKSFPILCEAHLVQWALCKQGLGACFVMQEVGDAEPLVRRVTPDFPPIPVPMWLVAHREVATAGRVRAVFDVIAEELGPRPARP
jgi:DNA-binding transcriptional LysR family regulator